MIDTDGLELRAGTLLYEVEEAVDKLRAVLGNFCDDNGLPDDLSDKLFKDMDLDVNLWKSAVEDHIYEISEMYSDEDIMQMGRDFARDRLFGDGDDPIEFGYDTASYAVDMAASVFCFNKTNFQDRAADLMLMGMDEVLKERKETTL